MVWSYLSRIFSFSRDATDDHSGRSSSKSEAELSPASLRSITNPSIEDVPARQSDSEILNDIVEDPESNLAESPPAPLPSIPNSSIEDVLSSLSDSEIPNDIIAAPNKSHESNLAESSLASLPSITTSSIEHAPSSHPDSEISSGIVEAPSEFPESNIAESPHCPITISSFEYVLSSQSGSKIPNDEHVLSRQSEIPNDIVAASNESPESNLADSLPSTTTSRTDVPSTQPDSKISGDIVEAPNESNLAKFPPAPLPSITISSIEHALSSQSDSKIPNDIAEGSNESSESYLAESLPIPLTSTTNLNISPNVEYILSRNPDSEIPSGLVEGPYESPESNLNISQLSLMIRSAHEPGNKSTLKKVRAIFKKAYRTVWKKRTPEQIYILNHWDPSLRGRSSSTLCLPLPSSPLAQSSSLSLSSLKIFVDASSYGIGFIFIDRWLAWNFTPNHANMVLGPDNNIIMHWAELIAVELGILTLLAGGYRDIQVLVMSDNMDVVSALKNKKWTPKYGLDAILTRILHLCEEASLELKAEWISTKENPADGPSRREYPPVDMMIDHIPSIPKHLEGLLTQSGVASSVTQA